MTTLRVGYNPTTRVAEVASNGTAIPGGSVNVGTFEHPDPVYPGSVVIFHGVRDLLYKRKEANPAQMAMFPNNITDMGRVSIMLVRATGVTVAAPAGDLKPGQTKQLTPTVTPAGAAEKGVVYVSMNPSIATVNDAGLVTAVAVGETVIQTYTNDGGFRADTNIKVIPA